MLTAGEIETSDGSAAALVLLAAQPWSLKTHELFPQQARSWVREIVLISNHLSRLPQCEALTEAARQALFHDVWLDRVIPYLVSRDYAAPHVAS